MSELGSKIQLIFLLDALVGVVKTQYRSYSSIVCCMYHILLFKLTELSAYCVMICILHETTFLSCFASSDGGDSFMCDTYIPASYTNFFIMISYDFLLISIVAFLKSFLITYQITYFMLYSYQ